MNIATSIILILGFIVIYLVLIQIYTVLFRITGLTKEKARFQTISLLTNCGFTTGESEIVTSDRARRRIAVAAMITGYSFSVIIVSLIINLFFNLNAQQLEDSLYVILISLGSFILLLILVKLPFISRWFENLIEKVAIKFLKKNRKENIITLLDNYGKDAICEILINSMPNFMEGKSLLESKIKDLYSMNILMLKRKNRVIEVTKDTIFQVNDVLVIFGSYQNIKDVFGKKVNNVEEVLDVEDKIHENEIELMDNYGKEAMANIIIHRVPDFLANKTLFASNIKTTYQLNVLMVKREDRPVTVNKDTMILQNDEIVVFGPYKNIKEAFIYDNKEEK